jgi:hypothetical protein
MTVSQVFGRLLCGSITAEAFFVNPLRLSMPRARARTRANGLTGRGLRDSSALQ